MNRFAGRRNINRFILQNRFDRVFDRRWRNQRLIALNIDDNRIFRQIFGDFGNSVASRLMIFSRLKQLRFRFLRQCAKFLRCRLRRSRVKCFSLFSLALKCAESEAFRPKATVIYSANESKRDAPELLAMTFCCWIFSVLPTGLQSSRKSSKFKVSSSKFQKNTAFLKLHTANSFSRKTFINFERFRQFILSFEYKLLKTLNLEL